MFVVRWLHINLCKWRLWLYFYKLETTGLPSKKERDREGERKHQCSRKKTFIFAGYNDQWNMSLFSGEKNERFIRVIKENGVCGKEDD